MSFPNDRTYTFDVNLELSDNAAPYTASGFAQVGGAMAVADLGGNQGTSPVELARIDAVAVCDVTAAFLTGGNKYLLMVVVSNDPSFGSGNVVDASAIELCTAGSGDAPNSALSVTGRYEQMFTNQVAGQIYEFAALYILMSGTTPSISISSFIAVLPEP